jgi:hypothetical protein
VFTFASDDRGHLYTMSQVQDYALRGRLFDAFSFLEYTVETYEIRKSEMEESRMNEDLSLQVRMYDGGKEEGSRYHGRGRSRNQRACYMSSHPKFDSHIRIRRANNHNYLPNIIGRWFPERDDADGEEFYYASMMAMLRPWRHLQDLKLEDRTWKEEGLQFLATATEKERNIIAGMQYYYDSKTTAHRRNEDLTVDERGQGEDIDMLDENRNGEIDCEVIFLKIIEDL